ncbi:MAG: glycosyltransferase [Candidatus Sungbacteria bacterium]|nr:glycosyltransferase [Candidatus Sungbacteria bacterium]
MSTIRLSYILTTRNKLPYLKVTLPRLLANVQPDEEVMVADAASTDGSKEYLADLYQQGKIHYFISEPDFGESHGDNKLFLTAHGELLKIITDDDVFFYPGIRKCKAFMLAHQEIDLLGTDGGFKNQYPEDRVRPLQHAKDYEAWQTSRRPFCSCGLGTMFRKSSLPLIGLWNPSFRRADAEFLYRVTSGKAIVAWYTNPCFVNISNPQSISVVYMKKIHRETQKLEQFYLDKKPDPAIVVKAKIAMRLLRRFLTSRQRHNKTGNAATSSPEQWHQTWQVMEKACCQWLEQESKEKKGGFLSKT